MNKQSGNALIYILIAIFLLGGLTVLLSRSGSQTDDTGSTEQLSLQASQILRYMVGVQTVVNNLQLAGCSENEISFEHASADGYYNASSSDKCKVFGTNAGGGLTYKKPNTVWLDSTYSANSWYGDYYFTDQRVKGVGTTTAGAESSDMMIVLPYVTKTLCLEINKRSGLSPQTSGDPPAENTGINAGHPFIGTFTVVGDLDSGSSVPPTLLNGQRSGCVQSSGGGAFSGYEVYTILIAR